MLRHIVLPYLFRSVLILPLLKIIEADAQQSSIILEEFIYEDAPFPECHASTLAETPAGLAVAWFGGTAEGNQDVEIWMSRETETAWSPPASIANGVQDDGNRHPCWNPVLFQIPAGPLLLFYKVGPGPDTWWGELKSSTDHGISWSNSKKLPHGLLGPVKNKPVLLQDGTLFCPSSRESDGWRVHFEATKDMGKTWSVIGPIDDAKTFNAIQPSILIYPNEKLQILCRSMEGVLLSAWSENLGKSWSTLKPSGLPNPNSGIDAVTLDDGSQVLVYNHIGKKVEQWGGNRTPLNVAFSRDGAEWFAIAVLEDETGEYSYPAVIQSGDGKIHVTYTWKRQRIKHVVMDPAKFAPSPIKDGQWPGDY